MSNKKKLVFRVGTGLAVTALALGTGCPKDQPKDQPNVNTVAPDEPVEDPTPVTTNNGPATEDGDTNGTNGTNGTTGAPPDKLMPPDRVNTIPTKEKLDTEPAPK